MESLFNGAALAGVKALVLEDDAESRELVEMFLSTCGVDVRTAASGQRRRDLGLALAKKIEKVTVLGGPTLARVCSRAACMVLGIPCTLA
jgi:CheY-like chemotaxis protein